MWIAIIAIVIVVALVAVAYYGGLLNNNDEDEPTNRLDEIYQRGVLRVGTDVPYPPFEFKEPGTTDYYGVDMDIVKMIADTMGVELEIVPLSFTTLIGAIQAGQIDIAISAMTITPERALSVLFSDPYYLADQAVLVAGDSTIRAMKISTTPTSVSSSERPVGSGSKTTLSPEPSEVRHRRPRRHCSERWTARCSGHRLSRS